MNSSSFTTEELYTIEIKYKKSRKRCMNSTAVLHLSFRTYVEDSRTKIQPLVDQVQAEATKLQEQVKPFITNIDDHIKPITDNFNAQVKPLTDNFYTQVKPLTNLMEKFFQQVAEQAKALLPPQ